MSSCFRKLFTDHPESVGETYLTHGYKASMFGIKLISYGLAEIVHAIIPGVDLFEIMGTNSHIKLQELTDELKSRKED